MYKSLDQAISRFESEDLTSIVVRHWEPAGFPLRDASDGCLVGKSWSSSGPVQEKQGMSFTPGHSNWGKKDVNRLGAILPSIWTGRHGGLEEDFLAIRDDRPCLAMSLGSTEQSKQAESP